MVKVKNPKSVNWGNARYLAVGIRLKKNAMKRAQIKERVGWINVVVIPEISYGMKRPFAYSVISEGGFKK